MRKLYKSLVLILALLLMATTFTVISFAEETKQPYELKNGDYATFDSYDDGKVLSYKRSAQAIVTSQDNGNKYVLAKNIPDNTVSSPQWDITYGLSTTYNIVSYPYFMVDFDIMTLSGSYSGHSLNVRPDPAGNTFLGDMYFESIGLSTAPYDWKHLSLIVEYQGEGKFVKHIYVNGEKVSSTPANLSTNSLFTDSNDKNVVLRAMKFYPSTSSEVGYDNMRFTYFPTGYASGEEDVIKTIANHNYNFGKGYKFPYKHTVATVTEDGTDNTTYYDNYEEAYAAVKDGYTFKSLYAAEIIDANGKSSYVTAEDFVAKFKSLANGSTVKLHNDIVIDSSLTFNASRTTTLDLNGYKMYRLGKSYTDYEAILNSETGEYEKGEALEAPAAVSGGHLFYFAGTANTVTFNLKSSRPGAEIYSVSISAERLLLDGKVVASTSKMSSSSNVFSSETANNTVNVDGKNLTVYANSFFYSGHGNGLNLTLNVDGGVYVKIHTNTNAIFHLLYGGTHTIKNATFVSENFVYRLASPQPANVTFDNCDFLGGHVKFGEKTNHTNGVFTITNCRIKWSVDAVYSTVTVGENTWLASDYSNLADAENNERVATTKTFTYTVPKKTISIDPITLLPYVTTETITQTYNYIVSDPSKSLATVTYKDWDGNVIKVATLLKGDTATPPTCAISTGDGYTGYGVSKWLDKDGKVFDHVITYDDEQTYTAVRPTEEDEVIAYVTEARMSFSYVAQFHMYFYLPVKEGLERPVLTGSTPNASSGTVLIGGQKYYLYTWWCNATSVSENTNFTVNFELDGVAYKQSFSINALLYAQIVLSDPTSDEEAASVANMIRYVKEARLVTGKSVGPEFDALIGPEGLYSDLADYPETYPDDSLDTSAIKDYIDYFTLSITGTPKYSIRLSQKAIDLGMTRANFTLKIKGSSTTLDLYDYAKNGKDYETNNTKVYNLAKTFTITVTVPEVKDAETGEVTAESFKVSADYSIGTYIKGVLEQNPEANVDLAKATYCFALAVQAYRNSVTDY